MTVYRIKSKSRSWDGEPIGILIRDAKPCYYAYRLVMGNHVQTGLIAAASVADYDTNRIRKHEFTRPVKEDDRVNQIDAVNAQTGPVLLAYPDAPEVDFDHISIQEGKLVTFLAGGTDAS